MADDAPAEDQVTITARQDGPYLVRGGSFTLVDADGNVHDTGGRSAVALCRCGGSSTKPFCDGTHSKIGFAAAERAVAQADGGEGDSPT